MNTLLVLPILLTSLASSPQPAQNPGAQFAAPVDEFAITKPTEINETIEVKKLDRRAVILQAYLEKHNAPLQYHAQDFVEAADLYNLDWKFVAAISGVESTFGKRVPGGTDPKYSSFNGWGWGVYGTKAIYFDSWRDGIFTVSKGLRENYFDKGLTEPYAINKKYAASPHWGKSVTFFLNDISKFEDQYNRENPLTESDFKVVEAGQSGSIN